MAGQVRVSLDTEVAGPAGGLDVGWEQRGVKDDVQVSEQSAWVGGSAIYGHREAWGEQGFCVRACSVTLWELGGGTPEAQTARN